MNTVSAEALPQEVGADGSQTGSLLSQVMEQTRLQPGEESYDIALKGVEAFISGLLKSDLREEKINKSVVDRMVAELDRKISAQVDEIIHHKEFQQLESSWRSLKLLVDRTNFRENIKIDVLSIRKEELLDDFEQAPEVVQSGLYKHVYAAQYGQFGGEPYAALIANYDFGPSTPDIKLLQYAASVGAMSHAPFLSSASPEMFGVSSYVDLPSVKELAALYEGPRFRKWNSLRESEDARYIGLTGPRFLLRQPYDPLENPVRSFTYRENVVSDHENYLWGNTAFLLAAPS